MQYFRLLVCCSCLTLLLGCTDQPNNSNPPTETPAPDTTKVVKPTTPPDTTTRPPEPEPPMPLADREWTLQRYTLEGKEYEPIDDAQAVLSFSRGQLFGTTGCNDLRADYDWDGDRALKFGTISTTKKMCPSFMVQERRLLTLLENTERFNILSKRYMELIGSNGKLVLIAERPLDYEPEPKKDAGPE